MVARISAAGAPAELPSIASRNRRAAVGLALAHRSSFRHKSEAGQGPP